MKATALQGRDPLEYLLLAVALVLSLLVHVTGALGAASLPPPEPEAEEWVVMEVVEEPPPQPDPQPEPEPEPEPEPQPEPEPEIPDEPEEIEYEPEPTETETEPEPQPQPEAKPVPRKVQGLDASSFSKDGGTDFSANRGNTVGARDSDEKVDLDEDLGEFVPIPYTSVSKPPKKRYVPQLVIPQSIIDAEVEGRVEVTLTVGADGKVTEVAVVSGLHPDADAACLEALRKSRWKPGEKDGIPVITKSVPYSCRFEAVN